MRFILCLFLFLNLNAIAAAEDLGVAEADTSESTMAIKSIVRKNNVLTVKGKYTKNGGGSNFSNHHEKNTFLLDEEKGVKYFALEDTKGQPLASDGQYLYKDGETLKFWVKFPAPPTEKKTISLYVASFEPLDDLPITDK